MCTQCLPASVPTAHFRGRGARASVCMCFHDSGVYLGGSGDALVCLLALLAGDNVSRDFYFSHDPLLCQPHRYK